jgi:hypothetical protein
MKKIILLVCLISSSGCIRNGVLVEKNEPLASDDAYLQAYHHTTRSVKVYVDFETKYTMTVTFIDKDFQKALATRIKNLLMEDVPALTEAGGKTAFFISAFGPEDRAMDINDPQLWNMILKVKDKEFRPSNIQRLGLKERWVSYFPAINKWTTEYLITFDAQTTGGAELVKQDPLELKIANADAKVTLEWNK